MEYVFDHTLMARDGRGCGQGSSEPALVPLQSAAAIDLDHELRSLRSDNPLEQLRALRQLYDAGLLSMDVLVSRQNSVLDSVAGRDLAGGDASQVDGRGDGSSSSSSSSSSGFTTGGTAAAMAATQSHSASPGTSSTLSGRHSLAGAPKLKIEPSEGIPSSTRASPSARRKADDEISPKPTEVRLEDQLQALEHGQDTAHLVSMAMEGRIRSRLW